MFSCTKGVAAIATMWAVARGLVDLDAPVASYWPEFAEAGKDDLPVRYLLTHEAGLPAIGVRMPRGSLSDWEAMTTALAAQAPWWELGTGHGYHGVTFGHLIGEVLRRATGRMCGEIVHDELARPLDVELWMPLPVDCDERTSDLVVAVSEEGTFFDGWNPETSLGPKAFGNPPDANDPVHCMSDEWRRAEIPAANMHANARALDRLYSVLAQHGRVRGAGELVPRELVDEFGRVHVQGDDLVMELPTALRARLRAHHPRVAVRTRPQHVRTQRQWRIARHRRPRRRHLARVRDEPVVVGSRPHRPALGPDLRRPLRRDVTRASSDVALATFPVGRAELPLEELARRVAGERIGEVDRLRQLVAGQVFTSEVDRSPRLGCTLPVADDHRLHRLAPLLVGDADHGDVGDIGVTAQHTFSTSAG